MSRASGPPSAASLLSPAASRTRPAYLQSASRVPSSGRGSGAAVGGLPAMAGAGSSIAASAARRPNTKHSLSELEASRLAPCTPVQAHSPTAYRPGRRRAPVEVGRDAADHVVGGGRDGDQVAVGSMPGLARAPRRCSGSAPGRRRACRAGPRRRRRRELRRRSRARPRRAARARRRSARRRGVEQQRALAAHRLGDRGSRRSSPVRRRARWGGTAELEVGERGAGRRARAPGPAPIAPRGLVVRAPERGGAAGREHRRGARAIGRRR